MLARRFAAALVMGIGAGLAAITPAQEPAALSVMTWNIAAGGGDLTRIAAVIREAAPDVAALQEVDVHWHARSGFDDQATRLSELTGMTARFGHIYRLEGDAGAPPREFGLAFLSRRPIVRFDNHVIPRLSTQSAATAPEPLPGFLELVVDVDGRRVHLFNTHLDYRPDPHVRSLQVAAMIERLRDNDTPVVLMGDLNAPPEAPEIAPLFERLTDAWSLSAGPGHTYPARAPVRRIDYILTRGVITGRNTRVVPTVASDHLPVTADLILR